MSKCGHVWVLRGGSWFIDCWVLLELGEQSSVSDSQETGLEIAWLACGRLRRVNIGIFHTRTASTHTITSGKYGSWVCPYRPRGVFAGFAWLFRNSWPPLFSLSAEPLATAALLQAPVHSLPNHFFRGKCRWMEEALQAMCCPETLPSSKAWPFSACFSLSVYYIGK